MVEVKERSISSHRSQVDIVAEVLRVTAGGARKTHIMHNCNLSFRQLQTYLSLLLDRGLLRRVSEKEEDGDPGSFEITRKGQNLLRAYDRLRGLMTA